MGLSLIKPKTGSYAIPHSSNIWGFHTRATPRDHPFWKFHSGQSPRDIGKFCFLAQKNFVKKAKIVEKRWEMVEKAEFFSSPRDPGGLYLLCWVGLYLFCGELK